ncbi:ATP-dependent endonuclease [Pseudonocardia sp. N23]|uniref:ATP-dependent nuclease n=1 Tax=Pseudonocardia sp. N23 TaxID=1987376 RepID=UPI000BFD185B|nr:AAA family ATPase [Pseudonocardia sp. N23]
MENPLTGFPDPPFRLSQVIFNSGQTISIPPLGTTILVGPNNSGKSASLREISSLVANYRQPHETFAAIDAVVIERESHEILSPWLTQNMNVTVNTDGRRGSTLRPPQSGTAFDLDEVLTTWRSEPATAPLRNFSEFFVKYLSCESRLSFEGQTGRIDPLSHPTTILQWLVTTPDALTAFRQAFRDAFGFNVIVDSWGANTQLRISKTARQDDFTVTSPDGMVDRATAQRLQALTVIENQSDGVRSLATILQNIIAGPHTLVLIDEPEAFLHPPQARLLGRHLGQSHQHKQLVIATHSIDVLVGVLEAAAGPVNIARLTRDDDKTSVSVLDQTALRQLWGDPLMRFSRVLDGLFHSGVVVCEGDSDVHFYSTAAALGQPGGTDALFTYSGGKQRLPLIARSLRAVNVPVAVIADFDLLRDRTTLRAVVESLGSTYSESLEKDRAMMDAAIRGSEPEQTATTMRGTLASVVGDESHKTARALKSAVQDAMRPAAGWQSAKKSGITAVPNGDGTAAAKRLMADLAKLGVFIVPVGEVEGWVPEVGGHGPAWVTSVVEQRRLTESSAVKPFIDEVLQFVRSHEPQLDQF